MNNSPELNGKYLGTITADFAKVSDMLKEASYQLRVRKLTQYPIFPVSKMPLKICKILIEKQDFDTAWNFGIASLEQFGDLGLVEAERTEDFIAAYKNPEEFCCLFVIDEEFLKFVFIPYPDDEQ